MKEITIFNLRDGFANNSSSSHSVIFFPKDVPMPPISSDGSSEFGWDFFTVSGEADMRKYLRATLRGNLGYKLSSDYATAILNEWTGTTGLDAGEWGEYVDHQSLITLPLTFDKSGVHKKFFEHVASVFLQPGVVVLGGNDNTDETHRLADRYSEFTTDIGNVFDVEVGQLVAKYDEDNDYWTLYNGGRGGKTRLKFTDIGKTPVIPTKASTPDLVDVKITDYCNSGCRFCYQGSTVKGTHSDTDHIHQLIGILAGAEVFEIAFGGGEPTQHPDFIKILKMTKDANITPNFTTKNLKWLREHLGEIDGIFGSFAYSAGHGSEVNELATIRDFYRLDHNRVCVQLVMGSMSVGEIMFIIETCNKHNIPVTLLGFKEQHRGATFKQYPYEGWLTKYKELKESKNIYKHLGVDTLLINQSQKEFDELGIPKFLYHTTEGTFSWYIDAVANKQGPSSFHPLTDYTNAYHQIISAYKAYTP